jgi:hypothetical protein
VKSLWCPEKEIDKKGSKALFLLETKKNTDIINSTKETSVKSSSKVLPSKGKISGIQNFGANFRPVSDSDIRSDTVKKISCPRPDKKNKNNQLLSWLQNGYILLKPSSVGNFLQENKELVSLLNEAYQELRKYFSTEDFKLELVTDAEIAGEKQLFVYVFTSLSVTDALKKFDEFDECWWLNRIARANGLLNFNLRFV